MTSILYPSMKDDSVVVLKLLLNEILKPNPPLVINDEFDNQLQAAVIKFKFQNDLFPFNATIDSGTFDFIKQLLPVERLRQNLNESVRNGSGVAFGISSMWSEMIFQSIERRQSSSDETPLDDKTLDVLRGYLIKLMADQSFVKFINAVIRNLPDKIYPNPNNPGVGMPAAKFNGTILENFDHIRKDGKFVLASNTRTEANYKRNVIQFDRLYFKPYSDVIINEMIAPDRIYRSLVKSDIGKGFEISEKLHTVFILVHELIHAYYPATVSNSQSTSHDQMARAARAALAELGIKGRMTNINNSSAYFNAALLQACGKIKL